MSGNTTPVYRPPEDSDEERGEVQQPLIRFAICRRSLTRYSNGYTISCTTEVQPPFTGTNPLAAVIPLIQESKRASTMN